MSKLKAYSLITGDVIDEGPPDAKLPAIESLGDMLATNRPDIIVFIEGKLPKWGTPSED